MTSAYADVVGSVTVRIGDVNMDGSISISDVTVLIDYLLGTDVNPFDINAADVNRDGGVNISDVTALIDYLLNPANTSNRLWTAVPASGGIAIENNTGEVLEVYNLDGDCVSTIGGNAALELQPGIYVVAGETASRKVVVK